MGELLPSASPSRHAQKWPGRRWIFSSVDHSSRACTAANLAALSSGLSFFQLVARLDYYVRVAALETLGKLDAAALAPHVAAIVAKL